MRVDINKLVAAALGTGVALSLVILLWGSVVMLLRPEPGGPPGSILHILKGTAHLSPSATVNLGLLVLLITPVARVVAALVGFAIQRDRKYVLISLAVLGILALSAAVGGQR